jgi:hypothetical protein
LAGLLDSLTCMRTLLKVKGFLDRRFSIQIGTIAINGIP